MNRRSMLFLGVFGAIGALATANAADASARSFVAAIYNAYKGRGGNGIALDTDAALRRYFEPGLVALISKDRKEAADQAGKIHDRRENGQRDHAGNDSRDRKVVE